MVDPEPTRERFSRLFPHLDKRGRRILAAVEATAYGHGGIATVSRATDTAVSTIGRGLKKLIVEVVLPPGQVYRAGGGRRRARAKLVMRGTVRQVQAKSLAPRRAVDC
jgi:hypothetical protein